MFTCKATTTQLRAAAAIMLAAVVSGCGERVQEYELQSAAIANFEAQAETIARRDDQNAPLAVSVHGSNQIGAPPGVKIWNPDATLQAVGIRNGDLIALIDGEVPAFDYKSAFPANAKPFASATGQYVDFVRWLLDKRHSQESVLLSVHLEYRTSAERKEHGGIHAREPALIRIVFP